MRDFADVPNAVGTFPDVTAIDCSGPGEVDGTADIADTLTDDWGWKQALLDELGMTPNDAAETSSSSQILDAIKLLTANRFNPSCLFQTETEATGPDWLFDVSTGRWDSEVNVAELAIPLDPPRDVEVDITVSIRINPGIARTGTNRMNAQLYYCEVGFSPTAIGSPVYDDTTTDFQYLVVTATSITPSANRNYFVRLIAGNDAATNADAVYAANTTYEKT